MPHCFRKKLTHSFDSLSRVSYRSFRSIRLQAGLADEQIQNHILDFHPGEYTDETRPNQIRPEKWLYMGYGRKSNPYHYTLVFVK